MSTVRDAAFVGTVSIFMWTTMAIVYGIMENKRKFKRETLMREMLKRDVAERAKREEAKAIRLHQLRQNMVILMISVPETRDEWVDLNSMSIDDVLSKASRLVDEQAKCEVSTSTTNELVDLCVVVKDVGYFVSELLKSPKFQFSTQSVGPPGFLSDNVVKLEKPMISKGVKYTRMRTITIFNSTRTSVHNINLFAK